jgi:hypothetical protein
MNRKPLATEKTLTERNLRKIFSQGKQRRIAAVSRGRK